MNQILFIVGSVFLLNSLFGLGSGKVWAGGGSSDTTPFLFDRKENKSLFYLAIGVNFVMALLF